MEDPRRALRYCSVFVAAAFGRGKNPIRFTTLRSIEEHAESLARLWLCLLPGVAALLLCGFGLGCVGTKIVRIRVEPSTAR